MCHPIKDFNIKIKGATDRKVSKNAKYKMKVIFRARLGKYYRLCHIK